jgi:serine/threonine protein kinase
MAPEAIHSRQYSEKSDVWSFGCLVLEVLTKKIPFAEIPNTMDVALLVIHGGCPPIPDTAPEEYKVLLHRCFARNPDDRPTMTQIVEFLKNSGAAPEEHNWQSRNVRAANGSAESTTMGSGGGVSASSIPLIQVPPQLQGEQDESHVVPRTRKTPRSPRIPEGYTAIQVDDDEAVPEKGTEKR